jgi:hypothetical protein
MEKINLNGKRFKLLSNSKNGQVDSDTIFKYTQKGNKFKGEYNDDEIQYGSIVGLINSPDDIYLTYHCILNTGEIKVGEANAVATIENGKIILRLNWRWISGGEGSGNSEYIEV